MSLILLRDHLNACDNSAQVQFIPEHLKSWKYTCLLRFSLYFVSFVVLLLLLLIFVIIIIGCLPSNICCCFCGVNELKTSTDWRRTEELKLGEYCYSWQDREEIRQFETKGRKPELKTFPLTRSQLLPMSPRSRARCFSHQRWPGASITLFASKRGYTRFGQLS